MQTDSRFDQVISLFGVVSLLNINLISEQLNVDSSMVETVCKDARYVCSVRIEDNKQISIISSIDRGYRLVQVGDSCATVTGSVHKTDLPNKYIHQIQADIASVCNSKGTN
ncbi:hypothetical protein BWP24_27970 (plasmid) [Vibrio campbellii]|nr:hypothetical protein BWP24_27970 [Vibrio campbellii]